MADLPDERPVRKPNRVTVRKYNEDGAYFITVCTKDREEFFGKVEHGEMVLSEIGRIAANECARIEEVYASVVLEAFVVMPNHVHFLFLLLGGSRNPSVMRIVQQWKGAAAKKMGFSPWQDRCHDNIILTASEFRIIRRYIQKNPAQWEQDKFNESRT